MRILHLVDGIPPVTLGGTGRIVSEVARGQAAAGHAVAILSAAKAGALPAALNGVTLLSIEPKPERWAHFRCVFSRALEREVRTQIEAFKPDIVHAHTISRQIGYRWMPWVKAQGMKLIVTCHDVSHVAYGKVTGSEKSLWITEMLRYRWTWNPLRTAKIRKYLSYADTILTVSDALREYLTRRGLGNLRTLHNGIDLAFWKPEISKADARTALNLPQDAFLFLLAGRMGVDKGSTLIAATLIAGAHLVLAGDRFSDEFAPVKDRMHIFKNQTAEEMKVQYAAADVVLVPSRCLDCFPTVCLEAMAMERPVMATSWGGAKESVQEGLTGWILDPLNPEMWREKMAWCMKNQKTIEEIGKNGRTRMKELSLEVMLTLLESVYRSPSVTPLA